MRIKQEYIEKINDSNIVKARLTEAYDVHPMTVQRWISNNDEKLTTVKSLNIICSTLGFQQSEILEECELIKVDSVS